MSKDGQATPEVVSEFNLEDFSWDAPITEDVVISTEDAQEDSIDPAEDLEDLKPAEDSTKDSKPTKVVTGVNEKGETEEELEESNPKQKGGKAKENDSNAGAGTGTENLRFLRDKGLISFEDDELAQEDFDEDEFVEAKMEETVNNKLEDLLSQLPQGLKDMIKYSANGGDFMEVVQDLTINTELPLDLELETAEEQKNVIRASLKKEGKSTEDINNYIEFLEFKDRLETEAKTRYEKYTIEEETREEQRLQKLKADRTTRIEKVKQEKTSLGEFLNTKPQLLGHVKLNRTEVKELPGYMHDPSVQLEGGRVTTKFNYDLVEALKDKEKALLLAKITKSNFNMKDFLQTLETKVVGKIENSLQDKNFGSKTGSSQQINTGQRTHLVDFL